MFPPHAPIESGRKNWNQEIQSLADVGVKSYSCPNEM